MSYAAENFKVSCLVVFPLSRCAKLCYTRIDLSTFHLVILSQYVTWSKSAVMMFSDTMTTSTSFVKTSVSHPNAFVLTFTGHLLIRA